MDKYTFYYEDVDGCLKPEIKEEIVKYYPLSDLDPGEDYVYVDRIKSSPPPPPPSPVPSSPKKTFGKLNKKKKKR